MKSRSNKSFKKAEEKRKEKEKEDALVQWFIKIIVARTLKELKEKQEGKSEDGDSNA